MGKFGKYPLPKFLMRRLGPVEETSNDKEIFDDQANPQEPETSADDLNDPEKITEQEMPTRNDSRKDREEKGYVFENFSEFEQDNETDEVNEEDMLKQPEEMVQPCEGCTDHPDTLSEKAKMTIKKMCDEKCDFMACRTKIP